MMHTAKDGDNLWIYSMGKRFRVRAISDSDAQVNAFMEKHNETALIACFGPFNIVANKYEGEPRREWPSEEGNLDHQA
jgi:hypothetical protein